MADEPVNHGLQLSGAVGTSSAYLASSVASPGLVRPGLKYWLLRFAVLYRCVQASLMPNRPGRSSGFVVPSSHSTPRATRKRGSG